MRKKAITVIKKGSTITGAAKKTTIHPIKCISKLQDEHRTTMEFIAGVDNSSYPNRTLTSVKLSIGLFTEWNREIIDRFEVGNSYGLALNPIKKK